MGWKKKLKKIKTYSELRKLKTFEDRFNYLRLDGLVGDPTFGSRRFMNQDFYRTKEWRDIRRKVIFRDNACDLGLEGYDIFDRIYIHHMNPITIDDILDNREEVLDPEFLICVSFNTHNAIHYGAESSFPKLPIERKPGDTILW